ncbi:hypothetical protein GWK08_11690 [Leptobacterium flavescens]|uniref:Peptidase M50 domain-containing protein n=1 Tax=Leptobacterium flavescens TaxID=472055 RepID=A0A6P0UUL3_9FLAO|nr:hypothetical protein [Leptobacterium flavescens]NER14106.1 hypothetical protein [Leptobacterium flavescens]
MKTQRINIKYIALLILGVLLSFGLHELAHWAMGKSLGYDMGMTLNSAFLKSGEYANSFDRNMVTAAGPLFTIFQAVLFFYIIRRTGNYYFYPFLLIAFFMRFLAMGLTPINPNDEARISHFLGLGYWILPILVCLTLFYLVRTTTIEQKYSVKLNVLSIVLITLCTSAIIMSDQYIKTI